MGRSRLRGARIGGDLIFDGATLDSPGDRVLGPNASRCAAAPCFAAPSVRGSLALPGAASAAIST